MKRPFLISLTRTLFAVHFLFLNAGGPAFAQFQEGAAVGRVRSVNPGARIQGQTGMTGAKGPRLQRSMGSVRLGAVLPKAGSTLVHGSRGGASAGAVLQRRRVSASAAEVFTPSADSTQVPRTAAKGETRVESRNEKTIRRTAAGKSANTLRSHRAIVDSSSLRAKAGRLRDVCADRALFGGGRAGPALRRRREKGRGFGPRCAVAQALLQRRNCQHAHSMGSPRRARGNALGDRPDT